MTGTSSGLLAVDHLQDLDTLLTFAPSDASLWSSLLVSLEQAKAQLSRILDFPGPNPAEKQALEAGSFKPPDAVVLQVSKEFTTEALFVSTQLNISESLAASLLVEAQNTRALWSHARSLSEIAVLIFYQMRASLLKVLERLFGLLHAQNTPKDLRSVLLHFANDLTVQNNKSDAHWTAKVLSQIDSLKDTRDKAAPPQSNALAPATNPLFGSNSGQQQQQPPSGQQQQQGPSISREVQSERASAIQKERCLLGSVLYQAAAAGYCPASVIMSMLKWLQAASAIDDAPILHVCVATLAALDPSKGDRYDDTMDPALLPSVQELALDGGFVKSLHATVTAANAWKIQPLRNVLLLQWTLFYSHACQNKPSLENETEIWEETVEGEVYSATKEGAITFMLNDLLSFRALEDTLVTVGQRIGTATVDESFYESTLQQVQSLVITFISTMHTVLKKIKNREEDARAFNIHGSRLSRRHAQQQAEQQGPPPRDIEALFALVETVFRDRPDAGLPFWADEEDEAESHRLHAFLRWAADSRGQMATAFFVMLASLSTGEKAAAYAFDFLAMNSSTGSEASSSLCSWSMLFGAISHYANALQQSHPGQLSEMPPEEVDALRAFARLLGVIVSHSSMARAALFDNQHYQPVASLLSLIVHPISLDLKGDLIRAVAAFCQPGGAAGAEAARKTWMLLEQSQVLPTLSQSANGRMEGGIVTELEAVEVPAEVYPTTSAFIELLVNLVQTPTDDPNGPLVSIPEQLGAPARRPGVDPYLGFAIDTVLLPLFSRRFSSQKQKWSLVQGCLKFVENCLNTLQVDLVAFSATPPALAALVSRPGFDMMLRLLASTPLFSTLLNIAAPALDDLENEAAVPEFRLAVLSALRVLDKLFTLEGGFTDLVLPALMEHAPQHVISEKYSMLRATQPLSDALLQTAGIQDIIPRIAALVNFTQAPQIALFSVKIATALSRSRGFATTDAHFVPSVQPARINRLVGFFDASPEADSIARGYVRLLEPGAFDSDKTALYDAALDLLIGNTAPDHSAPNVAHYLLGYTYREEPSKPVEIDPNSSRFGLGSIIELSMAIEKGILPATLAERCFNLIANLCTNEYTARCTHRFLRTQYNFFATMLSYLPFIFPEPTSADDASGHFILGSEAHETTAEVVTAILQAEAWLLKSVALELNELAGDNQRSRLQELVAGLYTTETVDLTNFAQDSSRPQQGLPCIQDVLSSLSFEWEDQRQPPEVPLVHFGSLPFASCITQETNGVQLFDLSQVVRLLSNRKRELQSSGLLTTAEHQADAANEMRAVIEYLSIQNAQKQTEGARRSLLQAWSFVVDILVVKALEAVPVSDRHTFLFDTLDATLQALESSCTQGENADALSATADILVSTLREDQLQLRSGGGIEAKLSLDRLVRVLKRASDAILSLSLTPAARGELYAVLTHLLRLVLQTHKEQAASSRHQPQQQLKTNIASATSSALQGQLQRLVSQIARDAITSDEIWQMAALNLLDILTAVMHVAGQDSRLLDALSRENGIQNILASLKSTEGDLIDCLSIDPSSLNALYIFEAKLAFLTRLALSAEGCQKLSEAQLIARLGQCDFLTIAPTEDSSMDVDGFLPSPFDRYRQILLAVVQLIVAYGKQLPFGKSATAKQTLSFLMSLRDILSGVLHSAAVTPTTKRIELATLVIQTLRMALPAVSESETLSSSAFGGLHMAALALFGSYLSDQGSLQMAPASQEEEAEMAMKAPNGNSVFDNRKNQVLQALSQALFSYVEDATRVNEQKPFRPVLTADLSETAYSNNRFPTMRTCLQYMRREAAMLSRNLDDAMFLDENDQDRSFDRADASMEPSAGALILKGEQNSRPVRPEARDDVIVSLHLLEMALLLFWRHVQHFFQTSLTSSTPAKGFKTLPSGYDLQGSKHVAEQAFKAVAARVSDIKLTKAVLGMDPRPHEALLEQLVRRISSELMTES